MSKTTQKTPILTHLIAIFSLFVVGITLLSTIFPALIIAILGIHPNNLEVFEIGNNALIILLCNIMIIGFGIIYYKNNLPKKLQLLFYL